jgi:hypothetical protein
LDYPIHKESGFRIMVTHIRHRDAYTCRQRDADESFRAIDLNLAQAVDL